jgi:hypothetical protein
MNTHYYKAYILSSLIFFTSGFTTLRMQHFKANFTKYSSIDISFKAFQVFSTLAGKLLCQYLKLHTTRYLQIIQTYDI